MLGGQAYMTFLSRLEWRHVKTEQWPTLRKAMYMPAPSLKTTGLHVAHMHRAVDCTWWSVLAAGWLGGHAALEHSLGQNMHTCVEWATR